MVSTEYRLEQVVARLIERLDGTRRSYDDPAEMARDFARIALDHVNSAIGEFREVGLDEHPDEHAAFLTREVIDTFLPRYLKIAVEMNVAEKTGFGMGKLAKPVGRMGLVAATLMSLWFLELRFIHLPVVWPVMLVTLSLPFWPDIAGFLSRRRYMAELQLVLQDMAKIQEQAAAYEKPERLRVDDDDAISEARRRSAGRNSGTKREGN